MNILLIINNNLKIKAMKTKRELENEIEYFSDSKELAIKALRFIQEQKEVSDGANYFMFAEMSKCVSSQIEDYNERILQASIELETL